MRQTATNVQASRLKRSSAQRQEQQAMASPKEAACQQQAMKQQHADKHNKSFTAGRGASQKPNPRAAQKHHSTTKRSKVYRILNALSGLRLRSAPNLQLSCAVATSCACVSKRRGRHTTVLWSTATEALCSADDTHTNMHSVTPSVRRTVACVCTLGHLDTCARTYTRSHTLPTVDPQLLNSSRP